MLRRLAPGLVWAALALGAAPAWAKCELSSVAALPVTMLGMRALLPAKINGQDVQFVVDSGAFFSFISPANADKFQLPRHQMPTGVFITGITGDVNADVGVVKVLTLANTPLHNMEFVVRSTFGSRRAAAASPTWPIGQGRPPSRSSIWISTNTDTLPKLKGRSM
jgi:hypothetical protein